MHNVEEQAGFAEIETKIIIRESSQYELVTDQLRPNLSKYFLLEQKTNFCVSGPQFRCESVIY